MSMDDVEPGIEVDAFGDTFVDPKGNAADFDNFDDLDFEPSTSDIDLVWWLTQLALHEPERYAKLRKLPGFSSPRTRAASSLRTSLVVSEVTPSEPSRRMS